MSDRNRFTDRPLPEGVRDLLFADAAAFRAMTSALQATWSAWGYREIILPTFEYADILATDVGATVDAEMYRFFDRHGRTLALRPDMTIPTARVVGTRLYDQPLPLRVAYAGSVFRYEPPRAGRQHEFTQAGVELIGAAGALADAESVALAVAALQAVGLPEFSITVGHVGFFRGLLTALNLSERAAHRLRVAVDRKAEDELAKVKEIKVEGDAAKIKSFRLAGILKLKWGPKGEKGRIFPLRVGEENNLESLVGAERFVPDGLESVYFIDHCPPTPSMARVQKFNFKSEKLERVEILPPSTLFNTDGGGRFGYVFPRGIKSSEDLVEIRDEKGKIIQSLTFPPEYAAGEIFIRSKDVYIYDVEYTVPALMTTEPVANYFPRLISLKTGSAVEANYIGWDEKFYFFGSREVRALDGWPIKGKRFLFGPIKEGKPEKKFIFPWEVDLVGIDKDSNIYVVRERALSFSLDDITRDEWARAPRFLYRLTPEGKITHILPLPAWFEPSMYIKFYVWVSPEGDVWVLSENKNGVEVRKYTPKEQ